jgi:hypothetical protein
MPRKAAVTLLLLTAFAAAADRPEWQQVSRLRAGDQVRVSLASGRTVEGRFQSSTPEAITVSADQGGVETSKGDVRRVERLREGGWGRGKAALVGAGIGFGGGFALGAAVTGCKSKGGLADLGCVSRGTGGALVGGLGAVVGAAIGALWPHNHKNRIDLIYAAQ